MSESNDLVDLLRLAADRLERDPMCGLDVLTHTCEFEYDVWQRSGFATEVLALHARRHSIRFDMWVVEPTKPRTRCRCGLVGDHEPTCPEVE